MVEYPPPSKNDEEHPLLKVESGGGDSGRPPAPLPATGWNVTCSPRRSLADRWPELFSACWMTGMLLGIFVLIIYGLGTMGVIRRPPLFIVNCNESRPASEVHYHYLVEDGVEVPFKALSEYLSYMATQYPGLHFNVIFLIGNNRNRYRTFPYYFKMKQTSGTIGDLHMFRDYHLKYHNINMTIINLPKFMAMTPWRFKWKKIPTSNLVFYLRVYSVWKYGGIGMHFDTLSFHRNTEDLAITAILKQHNDGIKPEKYSHTLNRIDRDEQNEFVSLIYGILNQILNETRSFLNKSLISFENHTESSLPKHFVGTHRYKRDTCENNQNSSYNNFEVKNSTEEHANTSDITILDAAYRGTDHALAINSNNSLLSILGKGQTTYNKTETLNYGEVKSTGNKSELKFVIPVSEVPQVLLLYDFSVFSESLGPSYLSPEMVIPTNLSPIRYGNIEQEQEMAKTVGPPNKKISYLISIALDGSFIATTSKQHPFLGHLMSSACQRMPPRLAIQHAILTQCPTMFADSDYCSSIFIL